MTFLSSSERIAGN